MKVRVPERPPLDIAGVGDDPRRGRPQLLLLVERAHPSSGSLKQVVWLARRLRAEVVVASIVTRGRGLDELDRVRLEAAEEGLRGVVEDLVQQGVSASGEARAARNGDEGLAASDLADRLDADLVAVLARRGSWFGVLPGSPLAHHLLRDRRRPVVVIPDRSPRPTLKRLALGLVGTTEDGG